ncbi:hypothetical protein HQS1_46730 [Delftia lacustris]|nr:hypothetical protein HQS1_46730 [Delftia lacustris]
MNKAYTAVTFKMDTLAFARATQATEVSSGIRELPRVVAIGLTFRGSADAFARNFRAAFRGA